MVYTNGRKLIFKEDNKITSLFEQMNYEHVGKCFLNQTAKPLLEILENGDNTVDLVDKDYKRYIHIRLNQIIKTFDEYGQVKVDNVFYPVP